MAYTFYHEDAADFYYWMLRFKALVVANGGAVLASGDGLAAYDPSGDVLTRGVGYGLAYTTTVANGIHNTLAWFRLRLPGGPGAPELLVQSRATGGSSFVILFSRAGFTGGTPSANTPPTATDQWQILGASPTTGAQLTGADTQGQAVRLDACFGDADDGHAFYCWLRWPHGTRFGAGFWFDVLSDASLDDASPYLFGWANGEPDENDRFYTIPNVPGGGIYPISTQQVGWMWGYPSNGDPTPRPHSPIIPVRHLAAQQPYPSEGFRYVRDPYITRSNVVPTTPTPIRAGASGSYIKGRSRLIRAWGTGNQGARQGMRIPLGGGEYGISIATGGRIIARWDATRPRT